MHIQNPKHIFKTIPVEKPLLYNSIIDIMPNTNPLTPIISIPRNIKRIPMCANDNTPPRNMFLENLDNNLITSNML